MADISFCRDFFCLGDLGDIILQHQSKVKVEGSYKKGSQAHLINYNPDAFRHISDKII